MSTHLNIDRYGSAAVLSNAIELGSKVVREVAGGDVAPGFGGESLNHQQTSELFAAKLSSYLRNPITGESA